METATTHPNGHDALPEVPSGTVTFLFTDIEGSTKLLEQLREGYATVQAGHHRLPLWKGGRRHASQQS